MLNDAMALDEAGAFAVVLECVPEALSKIITERISVPTIGIGAGVDADGQVLVLQDMLGLYSRPSPKFSRNFMQDAETIEAATRSYVEAVRSTTFPGPEHSY